MSISISHPWSISGSAKLQSKFWHRSSEQRLYFDWYAEVLSIDVQDDWYKITTKHLCERYGGGLLKWHDNSVYRALHAVYPDSQWLPWKFLGTPHNFWDRHHRRWYFDWLAEQLELVNYEAWYGLTYQKVLDHHGYGILSLYDLCASDAVMDIYPEVEWQPWRFEVTPLSFWDEMANQRAYFDWVAEQLDLKYTSEWYTLSFHTLCELYGRTILGKYLNSPSKALITVYPDVEWLLWQFERAPRNLWDEPEQHRQYFDWLADQLHINSYEDWYEVTLHTVNKYNGRLLDLYDQSHSSALMSVYPDVHWLPWKFDRTPRNFWDELAHHRQYFDWLAEELGISFVDQWYKVTFNTICENFGSGLLKQYDNSPSKALTTAFPDVSWLPWKYDHSPTTVTNDSLKQYFRWFEDELHIAMPTDWYGITSRQVIAHGGTQLLHGVFEGSLVKMLRYFYPDISWNTEEWVLRGRSKTQQLLLQLLRQIFPHREDIECESGCQWWKFVGGSLMFFDVWIPSLNLALEYQGVQHYNQHSFIHYEEGFNKQLEYDKQKANICTEHDIRLICIPCWWDLHNIQAFEKLLQDESDTSKPSLFPFNFDFHSKIFGIETMDEVDEEYDAEDVEDEGSVDLSSSSLTLFEPSKGFTYNYSVDSSSWWCSIKHNGVRLITDGFGNFFSKSGKKVFPPLEYAKILSHGTPLDCELTIQEDLGPAAASGIMKQSFNNESGEHIWDTANIYVFDAPALFGDVRERMEEAKTIIPSHPRMHFVNHWKLYDKDQLVTWSTDPLNRRLEGLMMHSHSTPYIQGRHPSLLKLKVQRYETGRVISHHKIRCLLLVELDSNIQVWVHSKMNRTRMLANYPVNSRVQIFYYEKHTSGIPRNASLCKMQSKYVLP